MYIRREATVLIFEIPGVTDANEILDELGQPGSLYFIAQTGSDGSANYSQVNSTGDAFQRLSA